MEIVSFTIYGHPEPAGSKRGVIHPRTRAVMVLDANPKAADWKRTVAQVAAIEGGAFYSSGPLELELTFYRQRPKGHFRASGVPKDSAPAFPITAPDTTKLLRAVEDGLQGVLYANDAQIVSQHVYKRYGHPERAEVILREMPRPTCGDESSSQLELAELAAA